MAHQTECQAKVKKKKKKKERQNGDIMQETWNETGGGGGDEEAAPPPRGSQGEEGRVRWEQVEGGLKIGGWRWEEWGEALLEKRGRHQSRSDQVNG